MYNVKTVHVVYVCLFVRAGVMAGFNMSSDLQRPEHNIPVGTLAAVFTSYDNTSTHKHADVATLITKKKKNIVGQL